MLRRRSLSQIDYDMSRSPDRRVRLILRARKLIGKIAGITTAVFLLLNMQLLTPTSVKNISSSLKAASDMSSSDTSTILFPSASPDSVAPFGNGLAIYDNGSLEILLPGSQSQLREGVSYANPSIRTSDRYLMLFDRGSNRYTLTNTLSTLYNGATKSSITDAQLSENGNISIVTDEAGYKSAVEVHSKSQSYKEVYTWKSANYYITSAALSPDGMRLAIFGFRQNGLSLESKIFFTDINSSEAPTEIVDMEGSLCLGMKFVGRNTFCVITDSGAYVINRNGRIRHKLSYALGDLQYFDLSDDDCAAVCVTSYSPEARAEVHLLNSQGNATRSPLYLSAIPDCISYSDKRLAVLSDDTVTFYSKNFSVISEQGGLSGASKVFMRPANNCIALFSSNARVITIGKELPNNTQPSADSD